MDDIFDTRFENAEIELPENLVDVGDDINIMEKDPALRHVQIGLGWDANSFGGEDLDLDVCLFLLNNDGQTREDDDFVFYNQPETLDGAVKLHGDSRTGAGDGDDEMVSIDLQGIPFDVARVMVVVSLYKGAENAQNLGQIRGTYIRLANAENKHEILRYRFDEKLAGRNETAMIVGSLNREGPKWHFTPLDEFNPGGLADIATRFGIVVVQQ